MFKVSTCFNLPENLIEMRSSSRVDLKKSGPASLNSHCSWGIWWLTLGLGHAPSLDKPWQTRSLWGVETGRMWQVPTQIVQQQWPRFCLYSNPLVTSMAELNQSKWFCPFLQRVKKPLVGPMSQIRCFIPSSPHLLYFWFIWQIQQWTNEFLLGI